MTIPLNKTVYPLLDRTVQQLQRLKLLDHSSGQSIHYCTGQNNRYRGENDYTTQQDRLAITVQDRTTVTEVKMTRPLIWTV